MTSTAELLRSRPTFGKRQNLQAVRDAYCARLEAMILRGSKDGASMSEIVAAVEAKRGLLAVRRAQDAEAEASRQHAEATVWSGYRHRLA